MPGGHLLLRALFTGPGTETTLIAAIMHQTRGLPIYLWGSWGGGGVWLAIGSGGFSHLGPLAPQFLCSVSTLEPREGLKGRSLPTRLATGHYRQTEGQGVGWV
jgi:hypothetical protein